MLSVLYPHFMFVFQVIIALDIVSHWMQMYRSEEGSLGEGWMGGAGEVKLFELCSMPNVFCTVVCSSLLRSQSSHKVDPTFSIVMAIYYRRVRMCVFKRLRVL